MYNGKANSKWYSKKGMYANSTGTYMFNPATKTCLSYHWWHICKEINGVVVHNNHRYSTSTSKHQSHFRSDAQAHGVKIDLTVSTRADIANEYAVIEALIGDNRFEDALAWCKRLGVTKTYIVELINKQKVINEESKKKVEADKKARKDYIIERRKKDNELKKAGITRDYGWCVA